ncbi:hypothetical protein KKB55_09285 [Myxococcota bacterium]|nr:hypothetical protein [Myxococcota bacterium]MBU1897928.1 hypothetical protein [Myxococcota bacterium]
MRRALSDFEPHPHPDLIWGWLEARFGIPPSVFAGHRLWRRGASPSIWIAAATATPPPLDLESFGMLLSRKPPPHAKPTSVFLQRFGDAATLSVVRLDAAAARRFLSRAAQPIEAAGLSRGYCVARGPMGVLGCGFFDGARLLSETPKFWRAGLDLG